MFNKRRMNLFFLRVPLAGNQCESRRHSCLADPEQKPNCYSTGEVLNGSKAGQYNAPCNNASSAIFPDWKALKKASI